MIDVLIWLPIIGAILWGTAISLRNHLRTRKLAHEGVHVSGTVTALEERTGHDSLKRVIRLYHPVLAFVTDDIGEEITTTSDTSYRSPEAHPPGTQVTVVYDPDDPYVARIADKRVRA